ncbi:hypothetical protein AAFF_G00145690 [Aldrovandia affinis]|uniref:Uncharacterized protein n=1 Tax=Aldrovandia affinis TaxID=143900 RepID=A0AAD7WX05_9TELE|nr:hypothetical protein AAFF_G00145690 [Aldrovandia affinis]
MASLTSHYGQPYQLSLQRIADLMDGPTIRSGDTVGFRKFALRVRALSCSGRSEKPITRSKRDQEAVNLLDAKMDVDGVQRYATPLLRVKDMLRLQALKEAVLANLHSVERRLGKDPEKATVYSGEVQKLEQAGTTCRPCCVTYALQKHVIDHSLPGEDVRESVKRCFYVDNHLQSLSSTDEAKKLVD